MHEFIINLFFSLYAIQPIHLLESAAPPPYPSTRSIYDSTITKQSQNDMNNPALSANALQRAACSLVLLRWRSEHHVQGNRIWINNELFFRTGSIGIGGFLLLPFAERWPRGVCLRLHQLQLGTPIRRQPPAPERAVGQISRGFLRVRATGSAWIAAIGSDFDADAVALAC